MIWKYFCTFLFLTLVILVLWSTCSPSDHDCSVNQVLKWLSESVSLLICKLETYCMEKIMIIPGNLAQLFCVILSLNLKQSTSIIHSYQKEILSKLLTIISWCPFIYNSSCHTYDEFHKYYMLMISDGTRH